MSIKEWILSFLSNKEEYKQIEHELEINDLIFNLTPLKFKDSLELAKNQDKINFFEYIKTFISMTTTLDVRQIDDMLMQDAFSILTFYKMLFWDNEIVSENPILTPKDFLTQTPDYQEKIINIGNYRFSNLITLKKAIDSEKYCLVNGDIEYLSIYILAGTCIKGLKEGIDTLLNNAYDTKEFKSNITTLNDNVSLVSHTKVDLMNNPEYVSIISDSNYAIVFKENFFF